MIARNSKGQFVYTTGRGLYLRKIKEGKNCQAHRLIWEEHYGKIPEGYVIHHINGNKHDNRIENLSCISIKEHNQIHSKDRPIWNKGLSTETSAKWKNTLKKALSTRQKNYFEKCKKVKKLRKQMSARLVAQTVGLCERQIYTMLHRYDELRKTFNCPCSQHD